MLGSPLGGIKASCLVRGGTIETIQASDCSFVFLFNTSFPLLSLSSLLPLLDSWIPFLSPFLPFAHISGLPVPPSGSDKHCSDLLTALKVGNDHGKVSIIRDSETT